MPAPFAPPMPHHTAADAATRDAAALRRRLVEGEWLEDATRRQADFFAEEVRELLPRPVLSRNAALQVWSQIATLYDDAPSVTVAGGQPVPEVLIPPDLWPMRQQAHLLQVAANESLMRIDTDGEGTISYRVVPADAVILRSAIRTPSGAAPFNPTRAQPVRVEECRLRAAPGGGELWTWECWDVSDPAAPTFTIYGYVQDYTGGSWSDMTAHYAGVEGWPDGYRDAAGRPVLPYVLYHRKISEALRDPYGGQEVVSGTLDASALWTMWLSGVRDGAHPQRYIIDGAVPVTSMTGGGARGVPDTQVVRMNPQTVIPIHGIRRGEEYTSPSAGQWQPACDPASMGTSIESYEAGLATGAGLSPADVHRGTQGASGYSIVVSRKGQRDQQKKLIPPSRMGDQLLFAKAAALTGGDASLTTPSAWVIEYATMTTSPEEAKAEQEVIKGDLELGLTSRRSAIRKRNPGINEKQLDALIAEIDADKKPPEGEMPEGEMPEGEMPGGEMPEGEVEEVENEDAALMATLAAAKAAADAGDAVGASAAIAAALVLLAVDEEEDAAEAEVMVQPETEDAA